MDLARGNAMKRTLDSLVDKGCWISHDRVYAFVSASQGITEIGYHGLQPVSKNSRVFVQESGVLSFAIRKDGKEIPIQTPVVDWQPSRITANITFTGGIGLLRIEAIGRALQIQYLAPAGAGQVFVLRVAKNSLFSAVHGLRTWSVLQSKGRLLRCSFRDQIMLQAWLNRTGPYAGDFLIPEPIRKRIFKTPRRSGLATRDELRPEFQSNDLTLYDAETFVEITGDFSVSETEDNWILEQPMSANDTAGLTIEFSDIQQGTAAEKKRSNAEAMQRIKTTPHVHIDGYPSVTEFVRTVPGLVDSCIVQEYGIPRACPGRYYWIWAWDSLVSMTEALRWGDFDHVSDAVRFIQQHRDEQGRIPARWTRSLEPLDTPSPGGIEFLHLALAYEAFLEIGDRRLLLDCMPSFTNLLEAVRGQVAKNGLAYGDGFYPDLLASFGRNENSAVAMEVGSLYAFCRIMENIGRLLGDADIAEKACAAAEAVSGQFSRHFWDPQGGFFADAINPVTGIRNGFHPLFALLFLQSPLGMPLIRPHLREAASFISRELVTDAGIRVIPLRETDRNGETVLDSWYPHWDLYALKILRRAGDAASIMRWLKRVEETHTGLGYCPEFLSLKGFRDGDSRAWEHHGSASNLNCVTSWLRGIRESVIGFEFDPGGATHIPLSLPIGVAQIDGVRWRGGVWSFRSTYDGPFLERLTVDDTELEGIGKIPASFHTPGDHYVHAQYGSRSPLAFFTEVVNAKVMRSRRRLGTVETEIDPLGLVEVAFFSPDTPRLAIDRREVATRWDPETGLGFLTFSTAGACVLTLGTG
jgi:hypothetical protein